jgi:hypothetical protein
MTSERAARQRAERFHRPAAGRDVEQVPGELTIALPIIGDRSRRWRRGWRRRAWAIPIAQCRNVHPGGRFERGRIVFEVDRPRRSRMPPQSSRCLECATGWPMHSGTEGLQIRRCSPMLRRKPAISLPADAALCVARPRCRGHVCRPHPDPARPARCRLGLRSTAGERSPAMSSSGWLTRRPS